jgi:hypothetical protein
MPSSMCREKKAVRRTRTSRSSGLLGAIIAQQLVDIEAGIPPSTAIDPRLLDPGIRAQLKAALKAVEQAVDLVAEGRV